MRDSLNDCNFKSGTNVCGGFVGGLRSWLLGSVPSDDVAQGCESLEARAMLAGDLTTAINSPGSGFDVQAGVQYAGVVSVTNSGTALDSNSRTRVALYLSQSEIYTAGVAQLLAGSSVTFFGTIFAGATQQDTVVYSIPTGTAAGTYYIFAVVDAERVVPESNELNNVSSGVRVRVGGGGGGGGGGQIPVVDLRTSVALVNIALIVNQPINLNVTIINVGPDALPLPGTFARVYMTKGTAPNPAIDTPVGEDLLNISILKDQLLVLPVSFTLPEAQSNGAFRFYAVVDGSNQTPETNETNNTSALVLGQFNYVVRDVAGQFLSTTLPTQWVERAKATGTPNVKFNFRNASDFVMGAGSTITIRGYLRSVSATSDAQDIFVTDSRSENLAGLAAQASRSRELKIRVPTTLPVGDYRLVVKLDTANRLDEINEDNNTLESGQIFSVVARTFDPALVAVTTRYPETIKPNKKASVSLQLSNLGNTRYQGNATFEFYFVNSLGTEVATTLITRRVDLRTDRQTRVSGLSIAPPPMAGGYAMGVRLILPPSIFDQSTLNNTLDLGGVTVL